MQRSRITHRVLAGVPTLLLLGATCVAGFTAHALTMASPLGDPPGVDDEVLVAGVFATIPPDVSWLGIERVTLPPGATRAVGKTENEGVGPWLYRVETGDLTVAAEGPMAVTRRGASATLVGPGTPAVLHAGDRGATVSGVGSRWRNESSQPVTVLDAMIATSGTLLDWPPDPPGVADTLLVGSCTYNPTNLPNAPTAIGLHRLTLQPGAALPASRIAGLTLLAVEGGTLTVVDPGTAPGATPGSFVIPAGDGRIFGGTEYREVPAGWVLRNASGNAVHVLLMTMTPADPLQTGRA
jgi:hypothetical protein